ncbi:MAG: cellulose biosynthesis cyclic di-GMP-binding regulatory protein BcsB [Synergistales bacterium]|nr:cellulose biosynthesis cyclic di-GMP-binding regulatory protein BcsB [Synergistales bacterium]
MTSALRQPAILLAVLLVPLSVLLYPTAGEAAGTDINMRRLGYPASTTREGPRTSLRVFYPLPRVEYREGSRLHWRIEPSPSLDPESSFLFRINGDAAAEHTAERLWDNPEVALPLPPRLLEGRYLEAAVEPNLFATDDLCRDLARGALSYRVSGRSRLSLSYRTPSPQTVDDFLHSLAGGLYVVLPDNPAPAEIAAGVWVYAFFQKRFAYFPVYLLYAREVETDRHAPRLWVTTGTECLPCEQTVDYGYALHGPQDLVLHGRTAEDLEMLVRQLANLPLFTAAAARNITFGRSGDLGTRREVLPLPGDLEGGGYQSVPLEIPIHPGLLETPPEDLSIRYEAAYTVAGERDRQARLDTYWNGRLLRSRLLSGSGRVADELFIPAETGVALRNSLRLVFEYPGEGGECRYTRRTNSARLLPGGTVDGHGSFPLKRLDMDSFGLFLGGRGSILLGDLNSMDLVKSAAELLYSFSRRYPEGGLPLPQGGASGR